VTEPIMQRFFHSFYARISAVFLVLLLVLGTALAVWAAQSAIRLTEAADQQLNRDLAQTLAPQFAPHLETEIDQDEIARIIEGLTAINRRIDVYLLDPNGMIKGAVVEPGEEPELAAVDLDPVERFLAGADDYPILGVDPMHPGEQRPFSVAEMSIMGMPGCYLYITLGTEAYDSALAMMRESFVANGTLRALPLALGLTAIIGLILFRVVTRRLRRVTSVVKHFERGEYDRRVPEASDDEVGRLAASFNHMADTIVANMEELKQNDRLRRELVANVSHDLRSPLASIRGYLETVLMKGDELTPEQRTRFLDIALGNADRLSSLVAELFELSKFDAQQIEPHVEVFSIAELVQDVVAQLQPCAEDRDVALNATFPADLPSVFADIGLIERVITNLVDNALRHTPAGGRVEVAPSLRDDRVVVRVSDTGRGIPAAEQDRIFERFYRDDAARTPTARSGAGLGLAIVQKILALHGCSIAVESEEGKGATFIFDLPTARLPKRTHARRGEPVNGAPSRAATPGAQPAADPEEATDDFAPSEV
jgi:signal transduction histidine kinase